MISRRQFLGLVGASAGLAAAPMADAFAVEPGFALTVKHWPVAHADWPADEKPLRIGILSDIHAVEPWMPASRVRTIAERLNGLGPDIVVLLGDYVNALLPHFYTALVPVADWVAALGALRAPFGVYAVLGNHDWWSGEAPRIRHAFADAHIHLLENDAIKIERGRGGFWLAGLGDQLAYRSRGAQDLHGTLRRVKDYAPIILLAHEPDIFVRTPPRVTLTLAGHTHGGQVYIPFVGRPALMDSSVYSRFAYGHVVEQGRHIVVSSGLGLSNLPVRFLVPPEITVVTLSAPPEEPRLREVPA